MTLITCPLRDFEAIFVREINFWFYSNYIDMAMIQSAQELKTRFYSIAESRNLKGVIGISAFINVYNALMPKQKMKLEQITEGRFKDYMDHGSFIAIAYAYPNNVIDTSSNNNIVGTIQIM